MATWREELAWAAGFFDGEGHVGSATAPTRSARHLRDLYLNISQIDRRTLDRFRSAVGVGTVHGPYIRSRRNENPVFYFQTQSFEMVQAIIAMLWRWLSPVKREQASTALARLRVGVGQRRAVYRLRCKKGHARISENVAVYSYRGYTCRRCIPCQKEARQRRALIRKTAVAMLSA